MRTWISRAAKPPARCCARSTVHGLSAGVLLAIFLSPGNDRHTRESLRRANACLGALVRGAIVND